jgi:hypothetical protein
VAVGRGQRRRGAMGFRGLNRVNRPDAADRLTVQVLSRSRLRLRASPKQTQCRHTAEQQPGGGAVMGLLLSLAVTAPGRASGDALERQQAETLAALTAGVESVEARIGAMDSHLEGIGTKAREVDTIVGSLGPPSRWATRSSRRSTRGWRPSRRRSRPVRQRLTCRPPGESLATAK